jgi:hypothetical protein
VPATGAAAAGNATIGSAMVAEAAAGGTSANCVAGPLQASQALDNAAKLIAKYKQRSAAAGAAAAGNTATGNAVAAGAAAGGTSANCVADCLQAGQAHATSEKLVAVHKQQGAAASASNHLLKHVPAKRSAAASSGAERSSKRERTVPWAVPLPEPRQGEEPCWAALRRAHELAAAGDKRGVTFQACFLNSRALVHWFMIVRPEDGLIQMFASYSKELVAFPDDGAWKLPTAHAIRSNWSRQLRLAPDPCPLVCPRPAPQPLPWHQVGSDAASKAAFEQLQAQGTVDVSDALYGACTTTGAPVAASALPRAPPAAQRAPLAPRAHAGRADRAAMPVQAAGAAPGGAALSFGAV